MSNLMAQGHYDPYYDGYSVGDDLLLMFFLIGVILLMAFLIFDVVRNTRQDTTLRVAMLVVVIVSPFIGGAMWLFWARKRAVDRDKNASMSPNGDVISVVKRGPSGIPEPVPAPAHAPVPYGAPLPGYGVQQNESPVAPVQYGSGFGDPSLGYPMPETNQNAAPGHGEPPTEHEEHGDPLRPEEDTPARENASQDDSGEDTGVK